jgi:hypothetical protein
MFNEAALARQFQQLALKNEIENANRDALLRKGVSG